MKRAFLFVSLAAALLSLPARGGAPPFVPVQGFVTDGFGAALNGTVDMRFALYDDASVGSEIWSEVQSVEVTDGLFAAYLGQTVSLELSVFKTFGDLYLGVTVGSDSEMQRIPLGSVPFSGHSAHSSYVGSGGIHISDQNVISADLGNSVESIEISDGTIAAVDIAPDAVTSQHITDGAIGSADIAPDAVDSSHLADRGVATIDLAVGAVTTTEIQDGTIQPEDLAAGIVARADWDPVDINLGTLPFTASTATLDLPAQIPADARKVLVYLWYENGAGGADTRYHYRIYTQNGATQYAMKFLARTYDNPAWTFNSDNFWLPVTAERRIYVQLSGSITGNRRGEIHLLGYQ